MERAPNVVSLSGSFILENLAGILMVTLILILFRFYFSANNIKIEKQKTKVKKVLLVEKMENILENAKKTISSPESCMLNKKKEVCIALGNCVWAKTKESSGVIEKCLASEEVDKGEIPGSNGPTDICYCSSKGKLIPWEKYYYMKGKDVIEKKGKFCSAQGDKCIQ